MSSEAVTITKMFRHKDFQTTAVNEVANADLDLARSILRTAEQVLRDAIQRTYPIGAQIKKCVKRDSYSYYTVIAHETNYGSGMLKVRNNNTGTEDWISGKDTLTELVTYEYRITKVA